MVKLSNGLGGAVYKDESEYKVIGGCVHRYSKTLDKWILCLDEKVNKQIKVSESVK